MNEPINSEFIESLVRERRGHGILMSHVNHRFSQDWEDVHQEALLRLWMSRQRLQQPDLAIPFFHGVLRNVAMSYRERKIDRADYVEVQDWMAHCSSPAEAESEVERREREIREAQEQLAGLLSKIKLRQRITFWEWQKRGYRCENHAQQCAISQMVDALRRAAGVHFRPNGRLRKTA